MERHHFPPSLEKFENRDHATMHRETKSFQDFLRPASILFSNLFDLGVTLSSRTTDQPGFPISSLTSVGQTILPLTLKCQPQRSQSAVYKVTAPCFETHRLLLGMVKKCKGLICGDEFGPKRLKFRNGSLSILGVQSFDRILNH